MVLPANRQRRRVAEAVEAILAADRNGLQRRGARGQARITGRDRLARGTIRNETGARKAVHPGQNAVGQGKVGSAQRIDDPAQPLDDLPLGPPRSQGHRGNRDGRDREGLDRHDRDQNLPPDRPAHATSQSEASGVRPAAGGVGRGAWGVEREAWGVISLPSASMAIGHCPLLPRRSSLPPDSLATDHYSRATILSQHTATTLLAEVVR